MTPNPDTLCNRHIKFGAFLREAIGRFHADFVATGHYARITRASENAPAALACAVDDGKDQTYFLAGIPSSDLERVLFPVGHLLKSEVRDLAREAGLAWVATQRESMGICFIGKRKFGEFVREYVPDVPGVMHVHGLPHTMSRGNRMASSNNVDTHTHKHQGVHLYTIGQRALLGGMHRRCFVAAKDIENGIVHVVVDKDHPALFSSEILAGDCRWTSGAPPSDGTRVMVKVRHRMSPIAARVRLTPALSYAETGREISTAPRPALRVVGHVPNEPVRTAAEWGMLRVGEARLVLQEPTISVAPGQTVVVYDERGYICLGGGAIIDTAGMQRGDTTDVRQASSACES